MPASPVTKTIWRVPASADSSPAWSSASAPARPTTQGRDREAPRRTRGRAGDGGDGKR
jgi:hypothetical protein